MSSKVKKYLVVDLIVMVIITAVGTGLSDLCGNIGIELVAIALQLIINAVWIIFDLVFLGFFLLYWWSDVAWAKTRAWTKKKFGK